MFVSLRMIALPADRRHEAEAFASALRVASAALPGGGRSIVEPGRAGLSFNAGDVVWRMEFPTEAAAAAAPLSEQWRASVAPLLEGTQVSGVGYQSIRKGLRPGGAGIWRALVFRVWPHGFPQAAAELEAALLMMPRYIGTIRSWGLSAVATCEGPKAFTHVWEQEFDSAEGFTGEYMNHPIHWGLVDSWFDADCPQYIVDPALAQPVIAIDGPVIA